MSDTDLANFIFQAPGCYLLAKEAGKIAEILKLSAPEKKELHQAFLSIPGVKFGKVVWGDKSEEHAYQGIGCCSSGTVDLSMCGIGIIDFKGSYKCSKETLAD